MIDLAQLRSRLPGRRIEWFESTPSTMTEASRLLKEGTSAGTIIGAEEQTAGIGRHGHSWHSEAGAGLYVSLILDATRATSLPFVMLALGLGARQAIAEVGDLVPDLRWPNDVLLREKKCAGVLAQMEGSALIAGIGINVRHREFPEDIADIATSLYKCGATVTREDLLVELIRGVDEYMRLLENDGTEAIRNEFIRTSSYAYDRRVQVDLDSGTIEGITQGLDASGFLIVRDDAGVETTILAGGVRPVSREAFDTSNLPNDRLGISRS